MDQIAAANEIARYALKVESFSSSEHGKARNGRRCVCLFNFSIKYTLGGI